MANASKPGNWGKWGTEDERGALNYITPDVVKKAAGLVKKGKVYNLSFSWLQSPPQERRSALMHVMRVDGGDFAAGSKRIGGAELSDDFIMLNTHTVTHVDALCHMWYDDQLYNGFSGNTVRSAGARYLGIDKMGGLVGRGILLDMAAYKKKPYLEKGYVITVADLEGCAKAEGVDFQSGDTILLRTGWLEMLKKSPADYLNGEPGIGMEVARWMGKMEICAVGADTSAVEAIPFEDTSKYCPVHLELIRDQGVYVMEIMDLDQLAKHRGYSFLFIVAPLNIPGGAGSPISPLAIT